MATELRQLDFEFPYESYGISPETRDLLEADANEIDQIKADIRRRACHAYLNTAAIFANSKDWFRKDVSENKFDKSWAEWTKDRNQCSRSHADKLIQVDKKFHGINRDKLAGIPVDRLYRLAQDKTPKRVLDKALELAETHWLTAAHIDALFGDNGTAATITVNTPTNHEELVQHFTKKLGLTGLKKRVEPDVYDDAPNALRELAEVLEDSE